MKISEQITRDLMAKTEDDITAVLRRVLSIATEPLPIIISAGAVCAGYAAASLSQMGGSYRPDGPDGPDPECILLAGLLVARMGIGGKDPIGDAYKDFAVLKAAKRTTIL